jgi:hypothetical protein
MVRMDEVTRRPLREAVVDAWLACAPPALAEAYVEAEKAKRRRR